MSCKNLLNNRCIINGRFCNGINCKIETKHNNGTNNNLNNGGITMMNNKDMRMEALKNSGIDTGRFFSLNLPEGLKPGATISLVISEDGVPMFVDNSATTTEPDPVLDEIYANGYVKNTKLHRRFVLGQMMHMLNWKSYDGKYSGYNDCLKRYQYKYTFDMMLEEVRVLSILEKSDADAFEERSHFFTKAVVAATCEDHLDKLKAYVDGLKIHKCKGVPYKKVFGRDIFVTDLYKKFYKPIEDSIKTLKKSRDYNELYRNLRWFMRKHLYKLPYDTKKSKAWIDAYKGNGSYYTLMNLVRFHNCGIQTKYGNMIYGLSAVGYLKQKLDEYQGEGWRMFALMKKVIDDNHFDYEAKMREIGVR